MIYRLHYFGLNVSFTILLTFLDWEIIVLQNYFLSAYCSCILFFSIIREPLLHVFIFIVADLEVTGWFVSANKRLVQIMGVLPVINQGES